VGDDPTSFLQRWHRVVAERDLDGLYDLLADDIRLGSPPYWTKLEGKDLVHHLLGIILEVIEEFRYQREWTAGRELALEFHGRVGTDRVQGIDLITLDDADRVTNLDVMIRPLDSLVALRDRVAPRMVRYLEERR